MEQETCLHPSPTFHAPAERLEPVELLVMREAFLADHIATTLLDAIPDLAMVLNRERQIVAVNRRLLDALAIDGDDALIGLRPGEAAGCIHVEDGPGGCGTGRYCVYCGAVNAIQDCLTSRQPATRECRILIAAGDNGGMLEMEVQASFLTIADHDLMVVTMRDISASKRRSLLERVFFHDVLNTASGIRAVVDLMNDPDEDPAMLVEYRQDLSVLTEQIIEEIAAQRQLVAAEQGELRLTLTEVAAADVLRDLYAFYRHHNLTRYSRLELGALPEARLVTDVAVLRRVLGNLVKNALEATEPGGTVTLSADAGAEIAFHINNPGVMPDEIQRQIFQRSFSTKGMVGRGLGTYSVKLFTERYLGGRVTFTSQAPAGTTFTVTLPPAA